MHHPTLDSAHKARPNQQLIQQLSLDFWCSIYNSNLPFRPPKSLPNTTTPNISSPPQDNPLGQAARLLIPLPLLRESVSSLKVSPAHVKNYEVLVPLSPSPHPTHPHKPKIFHSLCCHGKGVLEAILLLGGGGGGGCCCCCCHGGRGPEGGGGGCPLGGGGGGGIMPIGGGGIIPFP